MSITHSSLWVGKTTKVDFYLLCCSFALFYLLCLLCNSFYTNFKTRLLSKYEACLNLMSNAGLFNQSHGAININYQMLMSCFSISVFCTALLKFPKANLSGFPMVLKLQKDLVLRRKYRVVHSDSKWTNPFFFPLQNSQDNQLNLNLIWGCILPSHINFISDALPPLQAIQGRKNLAETWRKYLSYFLLLTTLN